MVISEKLDTNCLFPINLLNKYRYTTGNPINEFILRNKRFVKLTGFIFKGIKVLIIKLNNDQIEQLDNNVFSEIISLESLDLSNNKLKYLSESVCFSLKNLIISDLYLNNNQLNEGYCIYKINSIIRLYIEDNELKSFKIKKKMNNVIWLSLKKNKLKKVNICNVKNTRFLYLSENEMNKFSTCNSSYLNTLDIYDNKLNQINLKNSNSIRNLNIAKNNLSYINLSNKLQLNKLVIDNNQFKKIDLSNNLMLKTLSLKNNQIKNIENIVYLNHLNSLDLSENHIELNNLKLIIDRLCKKLNTLNLNFMNLSSINLTKCENLEHLELNNNNIVSIELSYLYKTLGYLDLSHNKIKYINLTLNFNLYSLNLENNYIKSINLCMNLNLLYLNLRNNKLKEYYHCSTNINDSRIYKYINNYRIDIDLSENQLERVKLTKLINTRYLSLNDNRIKRLSLCNMFKLIEIHAENNMLEYCNFCDASSSKEIIRSNILFNLSSNKLKEFNFSTRLDQKIRENFGQNRVYVGIKLNLLFSNNSFERFKLQNLIGLVELDLSENPLLKELILINLSNLTKISFEKNRFKFIRIQFIKLEKLSIFKLTRQQLINEDFYKLCYFFEKFVISRESNEIRYGRVRYFKSINLLFYDYYNCHLTFNFIQHNVHFELYRDIDYFKFNKNCNNINKLKDYSNYTDYDF